ncbi:phage tail protein [Pseudomonas mosselii]|uniref:Phage tail protein n=1 Tax=Pseudomonas mosselii TaxID=78327 RepID=A0A7W2JVI4_9PSED|nr:phage tail protein [Pseudomonas mosselii]MBA6065927.1 phage tail protein [Pseudomonas mosselii]
MSTENSATKSTWLYSFVQAGWFSPAFNQVIPDDCVEVSDTQRAELLAGTQQGLVITRASDGKPALSVPPPLPTAELAARERRWRGSQLLRTDAAVTRHRDEVELGRVTTLTASQYTELLGYRAALRDWPTDDLFPDSGKRPALTFALDDNL